MDKRMYKGRSKGKNVSYLGNLFFLVCPSSLCISFEKLSFGLLLGFPVKHNVSHLLLLLLPPPAAAALQGSSSSSSVTETPAHVALSPDAS